MKSSRFFCSVVIAFIALSLPTESQSRNHNPPDKKVEVSGYIQGYFQYNEAHAVPLVGEAGNDPSSGFTRVGIRRARPKLTIGFGNWSAVSVLNLNTQTVSPFAVYVRHDLSFSTAHGANACYTSLGLQEVPFGMEEYEGSSRRLAPERADYVRDIFPGDTDISLKSELKGNISGSFLKSYCINAALLSGNGSASMRKSLPDGLLRVEATMNLIPDHLFWSLGASGYLGYVPMQTGKEKVERTYASFFGGLSFPYRNGGVELVGEYVFGRQPGQRNRTTVTGSAVSRTDYFADKIIVRDFRGFMLQASLTIRKNPVIFCKYTYYDRNTRLGTAALSEAVRKNEVTAAREIAGSTFGVGLRATFGRIDLTPYYEWRRNEKLATEGLYAGDLSDNQFTLRAQYRF